MMEHPVVLAVALGVIAFFVWQWIDAKRPAREPAFRPGYLAMCNRLRPLKVPLALLGIAALIALIMGVVAEGGKAVALIVVIICLAGLSASSSRR